MKVALCCIAKLENEYIREFVEHYRDIGTDKVFIYDNNDVDGEKISDAVSDFIEEGLVDVIDYRGKLLAQRQSYTDCYMKHKNEYDWFMFFDCDEFLEVKDGRNVKEFLSDEKYSNFQMIHINWMIYGDGGHVTNDGRPLKERIPEPITPFDIKKGLDIPENNHIKSIVRGGLPLLTWKFTPHTPTIALKTCDCEGNPVKYSDTFSPYCFDTAYLRHYVTKTIEEYTKKKLNRGSATTPKQLRIKNRDIDGFVQFFRINEWTVEKQMFINEHINEMDWVKEVIEETRKKEKQRIAPTVKKNNISYTGKKVKRRSMDSINPRISILNHWNEY